MPDQTYPLHRNDTLPTLYIPWPQCSHCGEDVDIEDGVAYCGQCLLRWDTVGDDEVATPDTNNYEDADTPCGFVTNRRPYPPNTDSKGNRYVPGPFLPCILPVGHATTDHLNPYDVEVTDVS